MAHLYDLAEKEGAKHNRPPSRQFQLALISRIARLLTSISFQSFSLADPDMGKAAEKFLREVALPHLDRVGLSEKERGWVLRALGWRLSERPSRQGSEATDLEATRVVIDDPEATQLVR